MALCESNRQPLRHSYGLGGNGNYIGLSKTEKRQAECKFFNSSRPLLDLIRGRKRLLGDNLQVAGSTVVFETSDILKTSPWKISTGVFFDIKRTAVDSAFITPSRARTQPEIVTFHAFKRRNGTSEARKKTYRRSISVDPEEMQQVTTTSSKSSLAGHAVTYTTRKDLAESYRSKRRDRSPLLPYRRVKPIPQNGEDSPTKAIYKRVLQRTLKQLETENIHGW